MKVSKILALTIVPLMLLVSCDPPIIEEEVPTSYQYNDVDEEISLRRARRGTYPSDTPTIGDARILVIPIEFRDFPAEDMLKGAEGAREDLRKAYFGESEETGWESLKSYYHKSSYGKLNISGSVAEWYRPTDDYGNWYSAEEFVNNTSPNDQTGVSRYILGQLAIDIHVGLWESFVDDDGNPYQSRRHFLQDYDADGDGFVDAVQMIYSAPINYMGSDLFWAFRSQGSARHPNTAAPEFSAYVWMGYDFLYEHGYYDDNGKYHDWTAQEIANGTAKIDTHTIIHETGHCLGADDYYTYDKTDWGSLGATDMMDHNIGDHNAYTKGIYGWGDATVVTNEGEVTVKSFTDTGQMILVPAYQEDGKVRNTFIDNYLLIEYYKPTGLNEMDANYAFTGRYPKMPNEAGLRVYHVDARLGLFTYNRTKGQWDFIRYVSQISQTDDDSYIGIANSNTKSRSAVPSNRLIHALEVSGQNTLKSGITKYNSSMMWQLDDTFGYDTFVDFTLNSGDKLGYKFEVTAMNEEEVTLNFTLA